VPTIEDMLLALKAQGFDLILIWMFSIAIIYGILTKIKMPESYSARGAISIAVGFLIMLASAGTSIPAIIENIVASLIVIGFILLLVVIFLELVGIKSTEALEKRVDIILVIVGILVVLVFLGSGAASLLPISITLSEVSVISVIFLLLMAFVIWMFSKEEGGGK